MAACMAEAGADVAMLVPRQSSRSAIPPDIAIDFHLDVPYYCRVGSPCTACLQEGGVQDLIMLRPPDSYEDEDTAEVTAQLKEELAMVSCSRHT